ncbi:MAG: metal-sensitive transcriptional regulator [candidate division SR1 bacterium]|nr:metal-sensitive transcriptional regulator [candidate division SR1 bacterium]
MQLENKKDILLSIKKASGTIKKVEKLIEDDVYCANIAQQINAAIGLLKSANNKLLESHIKCCGAKKLLSKDKKEIDDFVKELIRVRDVSTRK